MSLERLGVREKTMRLALLHLEQRGGRYITETGCARKDDEWGGDGLSTVIFGEWCQSRPGRLTTVDADPTNLATAKRLTEHYAAVIDYVHDDSVHYLENMTELVDLLYLDSFDYPLMDLIQTVGVQGTFEEQNAQLHKMGETYLAARHDDIIGPCQRHAEREIRAALPYLHDRSIVLIDDANLPGGGKARLARQVLKAEGWRCVMDAYQTLWVRA